MYYFHSLDQIQLVQEMCPEIEDMLFMFQDRYLHPYTYIYIYITRCKFIFVVIRTRGNNWKMICHFLKVFEKKAVSVHLYDIVQGLYILGALFKDKIYIRSKEISCFLEVPVHLTLSFIPQVYLSSVCAGELLLFNGKYRDYFF